MSLWGVLQEVCSARSQSCFHVLFLKIFIVAAVFFSTYEFMKKTLPLPENMASVNHMMSASVAEVVCAPRPSALDFPNPRAKASYFRPHAWSECRLRSSRPVCRRPATVHKGLHRCLRLN